MLAHHPVALLTPDEAPLLVRHLFARGQPGPITASLAWVPELLEVAMPFVGKALSPLGVSARDKEIAILRTSALQGCTYCTQTHSVVALDCGLSTAEVRALRGAGDLAATFDDPADRALIALTDAIALGPGPVPADTLETARRQLSPQALVELTLCVSATVMLNRYCTALALPTSAAHLQRLAAEGLA